VLFKKMNEKNFNYKSTVMTIAYIRVSTQIQTCQGQRFEIENWSVRSGIFINSWVEEKVSGMKNLHERTLGRTLAKMRKGDMLVCTELSRLGRNMMMVMSILNFCSERGIRIRSIKDNFELSETLHSKIIAFAFSLASEIERNLISQRTREALAARKAEGKKLGRPCGKTKQRLRFEEMLEDILRMRENKLPYNIIAERVGVHRNTLCRYLKEQSDKEK
jgi:DNA invertase Pin-like site-specific DNA recombinase